jgi:hypothetical protein
VLLNAAMSKEISFSMFSLIGYPIIFVATAFFMIVAIRKSLFQSKWMGYTVILFFQFVTVVLAVGILLIDRFMAEPIVEIALTPSWSMGIIIGCLLFFTIIALKEKSFGWIIVPLILFGPEIMLEKFDVGTELALLSDSSISFVLLVLYFMYEGNKPGKETSNA